MAAPGGVPVPLRPGKLHVHPGCEVQGPACSSMTFLTCVAHPGSPPPSGSGSWSTVGDGRRVSLRANRGLRSACAQLPSRVGRTDLPLLMYLFTYSCFHRYDLLTIKHIDNELVEKKKGN